MKLALRGSERGSSLLVMLSAHLAQLKHLRQQWIDPTSLYLCFAGAYPQFTQVKAENTPRRVSSPSRSFPKVSSRPSCMVLDPDKTHAHGGEHANSTEMDKMQTLNPLAVKQQHKL